MSLPDRRGWWSADVSPRPALLRVPRWFALAALAALAARVALLLQYRSSTFQHGLTVDDWMYWEQSAKLIRDGWLPQAVWTNGPLYSYFLALLRVLLPGLSPAGVSALQVLMNWVCALLLLPLSARLGDRRIGLVAAALALFFAPAVFMSLKVFAVTLGLQLLLFGLLALLGGEGWKRRALAGLLFGLSALAVPSLLLAAGAAALCLAVRALRPGRRAGAAAFALSLAAAIAPVTLSNYLQDGSRILISSNYGVNFYLANNPQATGLFAGVRGISTDFVAQEATSIELARRETGRALTKGEVARHFSRKGIAFITENPAAWLRLLGRKALFLAGGADLPSEYALSYERRDDLPALWLFPLWGTPILLLAAAAAALRERPRGWGCYLLVACTQGASCLIYVVANRHALPFQFLAIPFAAAALVGLRRGVRPILAAAGVLFVLASWRFSLPYADSPAHASAYLTSRIVAALEAGRPREAIAAFEGSAGGPPHTPMLLRVAGNAYKEAGEAAKARETYRRALALDPADRESWEALAAFFQHAGEESAAAEVWRGWLLREPRDAHARALLGSVLVSMGRDDEAEIEANAALSIDPASPKARLLLGVLRLRRGQTQQGIGEIERALAIAPGFSAEAYYLLALARFETGAADAARANLARALKLGYPVPERVREEILGGAPASGARP